MLKEIIIEGYKSIKDMDLQLGPINIFIGSNGVGKTNFMSFFRLFNQVYEQRLQNYTMQNRADSLLHYGLKHSNEIRGCFHYDFGSYSAALQPRDNGSMFLSEEHFVCGDKTESVKNRDESVLRDSMSAEIEPLKSYMQNFRIYHFHDTGKGSPLRTDSDVNDNRFLRCDGGNLGSVLYDFQLHYPKALKRIEMTIRSVMPYFERFDLHPSSYDEKINMVWIDRNAPDKYFSVNDLSDGSVRFIALSALLMQPLLPKMIFIDEPELGLHPAAIGKLSGMIKSAASRGCQIVISTQSVSLVNHFDVDDLITVDRHDGHSVFNRLDPKSLETWLDDYSLGELWTKSVINGQPVNL